MNQTEVMRPKVQRNSCFEIGQFLGEGQGETVKSSDFHAQCQILTFHDEGEVSLQWPAKMSPESYEYFKASLDLIARKAKRAAEKSEASQGDQPTDN